MRILPFALCFLLTASPPVASGEIAGTLMSEEVRLPEGIWAAPVPSPDGRFVAFTSEGYRGLTLLDLETGSVVTLNESRGAGFRASWCEDSRSIAFRTSTGNPLPRLRIVVAHPDGSTESATPLERSLSVPAWQGTTLTFARFEDEVPELRRAGPEESSLRSAPPVASPDGRLWVPDGRGEKFRVVTPADRVYFLPVLSPDGSRFVVECLDGHLYLGAAGEEKLEDLGPGSWPSFVRGGSALLFERTADDGHRILASDLFLMDLESRAVVAVTTTPDRIERRPTMAGDGHTLYFDEGGRIFRGWVP